jgi:hypothetical protein
MVHAVAGHTVAPMQSSYSATSFSIAAYGHTLFLASFLRPPGPGGGGFGHSRAEGTYALVDSGVAEENIYFRDLRVHQPFGTSACCPRKARSPDGTQGLRSVARAGTIGRQDRGSGRDRRGADDLHPLLFSGRDVGCCRFLKSCPGLDPASQWGEDRPGVADFR